MKITATLDRGSLGNLDKTVKNVVRSLAGALERIATAGGLVIEAEAKQLAPVLTGNLRRSIHTEITQSDATSAIASVGPSVDYGIFQEFGTRYMEAQPFMRPAYESKKDDAVQAMLGVASAAVDEALR